MGNQRNVTMAAYGNQLKMAKSIGASTQLCLTPFVTLNASETSPPTLTFASIPVCRASIDHSCELLWTSIIHSSFHSPVRPTVLNALLESTYTMFSGRSCSMHFSYNIHGAPVTSEATLCIRNYRWCYVGR